MDSTCREIQQMTEQKGLLVDTADSLVEKLDPFSRKILITQNTTNILCMHVLSVLKMIIH